MAIQAHWDAVSHRVRDEENANAFQKLCEITKELRWDPMQTQEPWAVSLPCIIPIQPQDSM